jgi:hypothetical protein
MFKKGTTGNALGRPKGIKDKRSFKYDVWKKLVERSHDPIENLINIAEDASWDKTLRLKAELELADRIAPRLKQVEITADKLATGFQLNIFYSKNNQISELKPLTAEQK